MPPKIIVIEDDPTGSQKVHSCPLLLRWDDACLHAPAHRDQLLHQQGRQHDQCFTERRFRLSHSQTFRTNYARMLPRPDRNYSPLISPIVLFSGNIGDRHTLEIVYQRLQRVT